MFPQTAIYYVKEFTTTICFWLFGFPGRDPSTLSEGDVFDTETRIGAKTSGPFSYRTGSVLYENGSLWFSTMKNWVCFLVSVGFFVYLILEGILGHGNVFARRTLDGSEPDLKYLRK